MSNSIPLLPQQSLSIRSCSLLLFRGCQIWVVLSCLYYPQSFLKYSVLLCLMKWSGILYHDIQCNLSVKTNTFVFILFLCIYVISNHWNINWVIFIETCSLCRDDRYKCSGRLLYYQVGVRSTPVSSRPPSTRQVLWVMLRGSPVPMGRSRMKSVRGRGVCCPGRKGREQGTLWPISWLYNMDTCCSSRSLYYTCQLPYIL